MKQIAIISGGYSSEIIISRKSAVTIFKNIDRSKFTPHIIEINKEGWFYINEDQTQVEIDKNDFSATVKGTKILFDICFITIHGAPGEDGKLQGYFDSIHMKYINSGVYASALSFNKWACNQFLQTFGIKVAKSVFLRKNDSVNINMIQRRLGFPCFVKPNDAGSSFGISKVNNESGLAKAIELAFSEGQEVVIEAAMEGPEVTCGVYQTKNGTVPLPLTEIVTDAEFFDFNAKYEGNSQEITPARVNPKITMEVQKTTLLIYQILGLNGFARADYILVDGKPGLIEINTIPGMSDASLIPQQVKAAGLDLQEVLGEIITYSLD
jgi:D-alanine-D-alanine ligase